VPRPAACEIKDSSSRMTACGPIRSINALISLISQGAGTVSNAPSIAE
jgi:hypothetical protein